MSLTLANLYLFPWIVGKTSYSMLGFEKTHPWNQSPLDCHGAGARDRYLCDLQFFVRSVDPVRAALCGVNLDACSPSATALFAPAWRGIASRAGLPRRKLLSLFRRGASAREPLRRGPLLVGNGILAKVPLRISRNGRNLVSSTSAAAHPRLGRWRTRARHCTSPPRIARGASRLCCPRKWRHSDA